MDDAAGGEPTKGRLIEALRVALKQVVGYLPDEPFLYPYLSGREVLELVAGLHGFSAAEARRRAAVSADEAGLGDAAGAYTVTYSFGMKKRLALAMALLFGVSMISGFSKVYLPLASRA